MVGIVTAWGYRAGFDAQTALRLKPLRRLGGGLWPARAGKVLPYTLLFLMVLGLPDAILFGVYGLPLRGQGWLLLVAGVLFILACQFLGLLLALLLRPVASAVSIGTLLTAPAFGFMGIGFPRLGMNAFAYGWGSFPPGTWDLTALIPPTGRGAPAARSRE